MLGTPAVLAGDDVRPVVRPREQAVLVRLALAASRVVPVDVLVTDGWGPEPPPRAVDSLRVHVSNLRKLLAHGDVGGSAVLRTAAGGYLLDLPADAVDAARFEQAVRDRDVAAVRAVLESWPGHDLDRLDTGSGFFEAAARRLGDLRCAAVELVAEQDMADGHGHRAVMVLEDAVAGEPYRERLWELLIGALAAGDRRADALRAFQRAREALAEVGMEPGPALVAAEASVLRDEAGQARPTRQPQASPRVQLAAEYVDVGGSRVAFATTGRGDRDLLFLHGGFVPFDVMPEEPGLWRFVTELGRRFRVVLVDRRGIGMSDPPADGAPVRLDHWVADCHAVLDALSAPEVVVLGHEHGGPTALRVAAEDPDRVVGLVLHSTAAKPMRGADHPYGATEETFRRIDRMIDREPGATDIMDQVAPSAGEDPALRAWLERAGRLGAGPAQARQLHRAYFEVDVRDVLGAVRAPAVVLHPARLVRGDPGQARYLADHLPDAELQLLDSGDHLFWLADADVVLRAVDRLVERIDDRRPGRPSPRLRALVAAAPPGGVGPVLAAHGAEATIELDGAVVGIFSTLGAARATASALGEALPGTTVLVEVADTTGIETDEVVLAVATSARSAAERGP